MLSERGENATLKLGERDSKWLPQLTQVPCNYYGNNIHTQEYTHTHTHTHTFLVFTGLPSSLHKAPELLATRSVSWHHLWRIHHPTPSLTHHTHTHTHTHTLWLPVCQLRCTSVYQTSASHTMQPTLSNWPLLRSVCKLPASPGCSSPAGNTLVRERERESGQIHRVLARDPRSLLGKGGLGVVAESVRLKWTLSRVEQLSLSLPSSD